jgi:hypothetical protein
MAFLLGVVKAQWVLPLCLGMAVFSQLLASNAVAELSPMEVLQRADESRGNLKGVEWDVSVLSKERDRTSEMTFFVQARGFDVLATTLSPPKDKGNKILLLNGNMWFHKPGLSKPVPISQRQKLLGIASYGDIASTNYANDYEATLNQNEIVDNELCYVYDLKSKTNKTTYDRIRYWVSQERLVGVKGEYFTLSGKMIKTATMEHQNNVQIDGKTRLFISKLVIQDVLMTANQTTLVFGKTSIKEIPDHVYNLNLLVK